MAAARGNTLILASLQVAKVIGVAGGNVTSKDRSDVGTVNIVAQTDADAAVATSVGVPANAPAVGAKVFVSGLGIPVANESVDTSAIWVVRDYATTPDLGATVQAVLQNAGNPQKWIAVVATGIQAAS